MALSRRCWQGTATALSTAHTDSGVHSKTPTRDLTVMIWRNVGVFQSCYIAPTSLTLHRHFAVRAVVGRKRRIMEL